MQREDPSHSEEVRRQSLHEGLETGLARCDRLMDGTPVMALCRPNARMELLFQKGKAGPDLGLKYRSQGKKGQLTLESFIFFVLVMALFAFWLG